MKSHIVEQRDSLLEVLSWRRVVYVAGRFHALLVVLIGILGA